MYTEVKASAKGYSNKVISNSHETSKLLRQEQCCYIADQFYYCQRAAERKDK